MLATQKNIITIENIFNHLTKHFKLENLSDLRFFEKEKISQELNKIKPNVTQSQLNYICNYIGVEV